MAIVAPKYRDTDSYRIVRLLLIGAARCATTISYQDVAKIMGLPSQGNYMGKEVGYLLGEISDDENDAGRPMLSAVAVGTSTYPGEGFFGFAKDLCKLDAATSQEKQAFWRTERDAVYRAWGPSQL